MMTDFPCFVYVQKWASRSPAPARDEAGPAAPRPPSRAPFHSLVCGLTLRTRLADNAPILSYCQMSERVSSMYKAVALALAMATAVCSSGCALIGKHSVPTDNGRKTTVGLISIESVGDGYPMIPLYSGTDIGKK